MFFFAITIAIALAILGVLVCLWVFLIAPVRRDLNQFEVRLWGNRRGFFEGLQSGLQAARRRRAEGIPALDPAEAVTDEERTKAFFDGLQHFADHS